MNGDMTSYVSQKVESSILKAQHEKNSMRKGARGKAVLILGVARNNFFKNLYNF